MPTKLPLFDAAYPREILKLVFTPEDSRPRPRSDYPSDTAARCLMLVPERFYIVESTTAPGLNGLPVQISKSLTRSWRAGHERTDHFRVNAFRDDAILAIAHGNDDPKARQHNFANDCYKAAKALVDKILTETKMVEEMISGNDPPDLPLWDQLHWQLSGVATYPFGQLLSYASERLGMSATAFRAGGWQNRRLGEACRMQAVMALKMPEQLVRLTRLTAEAGYSLKHGTEVQTDTYTQLQELKNELEMGLGRPYNQPMVDRLNGRVNNASADRIRDGLMRLQVALNYLDPNRVDKHPNDVQDAMDRLKLAARGLVPP